MNMTEYTLFLDESTSDDDNFVCMGGFAIKNDDITLLREKINKIRKVIWDETYIEQNNPTLHAVELNTIYHKRKSNHLEEYIHRDEYTIFLQKDPEEIRNIYETIYQELSIILKTMNVTVFACVVDKNNYEYLYGNKRTDNIYHICLESIMENYIHFLNDKNAVGSIIYESRNSPSRNDAYSLDEKMFNAFCAVKVANKGLLHTTQKSTLFRLRTFTFQRKSGSALCLAFADFIVYNVSKMQHIKELNNRTEFMNKIYANAYNGSNKIELKDLRDYFGIQILPIDIRLIQELKVENKKLRKKVKNQKNDISKLKKKNIKLIKEKEQIIEETKEQKE